MAPRIDLFPGETAPHACRRLKKTLYRECIDDRIRRRLWGTEYYQKPGYVRRQEKFFAKVNRRNHQRLVQIYRLMGLKMR